MKNKKAALELSVTAIVVLILAIVMLGLGLGFVRGMFGKVTTTFEEQIATEPEPPKPSASDPITLSKGRVIVHPGDTAVVKVSLYNPTNAAYAAFVPATTCTGITINTIAAASRAVPVAEFRTWSMVFTVPSTQAAATALCQVTLGTHGSIDFTTVVKD